MSGSASNPDKAGPTLTEAVQEVRGAFPSDAAIQDAISRLSMAGFDRAEISLPDADPTPTHATPEQSAENPETEDDSRQSRTLHTSMAASVGALAAAGAVVATGGAALPAVAAAVVGAVGLGAAAEGVSKASDKMQHDLREEAAARGELLLSVHLRDPARQAVAEQAMREAGASRIEGVVRASGRAAGAI
ncbi:MAG: hypothetical protein J0H14_21445 [Alphaproteobacteria bacterium]|nr:hypothetical protein [Alphaproteobacteria bacterium]